MFDRRQVVLCAISAALAARFSRAFAEPQSAKAPSVSRIRLEDFGITGRNAEDVSDRLQAALNQLAATGGEILCPAGTVMAHDISLPNNATIKGCGINATTIKLSPRANAHLLQHSGYVQDSSFANLYLGIEDLTLNGNNAQNESGSLLVLRGYRSALTRVRFADAPEHGILYTDESRGGVANHNGLAENSIESCIFDKCRGAGLFAMEGGANRISDMFIRNSIFNGNGSSGFYQIDLQRSAGFQIVGNQMYGGALGDLRALGAGPLIVALNNFDGTTNGPTEGIVRQVLISAGGWETAAVYGNIFHTHARSLNGAREWHQLEIRAKDVGTISVTGNVFKSELLPNVKSIVILAPTPGKSLAMAGNAFSANSPPPEQ